jgi:hypothetical protein
MVKIPDPGIRDLGSGINNSDHISERIFGVKILETLCQFSVPNPDTGRKNPDQGSGI